MLEGIKGLTGVEGHATANIRFYCDDDPIDLTPDSTVRWQAVLDRDGDPTPNSRRILGVDKELFDQYNYMRIGPSAVPLRAILPGMDHAAFAYTANNSMIGLETFTYNGKAPPANLAEIWAVVPVSHPTHCRYALPMSRAPAACFLC